MITINIREETQTIDTMVNALEEVIRAIKNGNTSGIEPDFELLGEEEKFYIGQTVLVPAPNETDIHNHEFQGYIEGFRNGNAIIIDGDNNSFEIELDRLTDLED